MVGQAAEEDCVFVMTDRSARNLAWQDGLPGDNHVPVKLAEFKGSELLGLPVAVRFLLRISLFPSYSCLGTSVRPSA